MNNVVTTTTPIPGSLWRCPRGYTWVYIQDGTYHSIKDGSVWAGPLKDAVPLSSPQVPFQSLNHGDPFTWQDMNCIKIDQAHAVDLSDGDYLPFDDETVTPLQSVTITKGS